MKIISGNIFQTIGRTEDFKPVLSFKVGQLKLAQEELTNYFSGELTDFYRLNLTLTEEVEQTITTQLLDRAKAKAIEVLVRVTGKTLDYEPCFVNNKFFTFLPTVKH